MLTSYYKTIAVAILLSGVFVNQNVFSQIAPEDQKILDSLIKHDDFFKMLNEIGNPRSLFRVNVGLGTMPYSTNNKGIQNIEVNKQLLVTPSIGYYHKSGFGLSARAYATQVDESFSLYQYALSPSYAYTTGTTFDAFAAYTHYFKENKFNSTLALLDDEFVGSLGYVKGWLVPRVIASYSLGKYNEAVSVDTSYLERNRIIILRYNDTAHTKISALSVATAVEHDFFASGLLSDKDGLRFTPQLAAFFGVNNFSVTYSSTIALYQRITKQKLKTLNRYRQSGNVNGKFEMQSLGLDLNLNYTIGKFYVEPDLYLDYYLHGEEGDRFSQVYNVSFGVTF